MKKIETISREKLIQIMHDSEKMFDIVRVVDPDHTSILSFHEDGIIYTEMEPCFKVWNKNERCENCVSKGACIQKRRMTKFEYKDNEMYSVIAMPFVIQDENHEYMISLELVNHIADDVTVKNSEEQLKKGTKEVVHYKIYKDSLTGVYNRRYFDERQYVTDMKKQNVQKAGFILVDVNRFKHINDYYGHASGDELLFEVATALKNGVRSSDSVIRIGGDEFFVVLMNCNKIFVQKKMAELKRLVSGITLDWLGEMRPSIATGMSFTDRFDGSEEQLSTLFKAADQKMYENKSMPIESKKGMLIVDDIEINREVLKEYFKKDFIIYEASDGYEGISQLKKNSIEIVLADINMPNMNGIEMIRRIRREPEIGKVVIFAITDRGEKWELESLDAGADDFINKPFNPELLNHRIQGVLSQNTIFNRTSQYQLSFNQNQIPFATVKCENDLIKYEYVNDAFSQLMNGAPADFVSGRREINFRGFKKFIKEVCETHQRKQIHVHDDDTGKYYDIVAYSQNNGFCSFIVLKNDVYEEVKDSEVKYAKYARRMSKALLGSVNVYTEINIADMKYRQINLHDAEYFDVKMEGDYAMAFEHMCKEEINPEDVFDVRKKLAPEIIKAIGEDDNGINEIRVQYRLKKAVPVRLMESRAFFVREKEQRYVVVTAEDITKEMLLQEQNAKLSNIFEYIGSGVVVFRTEDGTTRVISANPACCQLLGMDAFNVVGLNMEEVFAMIHPDDLGMLRVEWDKLSVPGTSINLECRIINRKMKCYVWILVQASSVLQENGTILIYLSFYDITEQMKLQEMKALMESERKAAEDKTRLLADMSHEIRTPMNAIVGLTKLTTDLVKGNPEAEQNLIQINKSSHYLLGVLNDILDMSKIGDHKIEINKRWISQRDIIVPVIEMIEQQAKEKDITLEYDQNILNANEVEAYTDDVKVKQILMNILTNAVKFTKEGGVIKYSGETKAVNQKDHTAIVRISIEDNGCGMSDAFLEKIFTPFSQERTDDNYGIPGTGLGLAVSYSIATALGGDISVKSTLGKGSLFVVSFPIEYRMIDKKIVDEQKDKGHSTYQSLSGKRVLLAEDHPLNAVIAIKILEKVGVIVAHAHDGKEAVNMFAKSSVGTYDAILMDVRMPQMDGLTATKVIRKLDKADSKKIPIIAMTANAYEEDRKKSLDAGMNDHLSKPIEPETMYQALEKYMQ